MVLTQRAIPSFADGLTNASRRIMWVSKRTGRQKSASLAGATLYLHPHGEPYSVVKTLGGKYINNYPLLDGSGSWGTLLDPREIGQPRYTSAEVSDFANDVLFADMNLIEMVPNYDETSEEPKHFLPLIPIQFLNHYTGIAVGYAANILPRSLESIINAQIKVLQGKKIRDTDLVAFVKPYNAVGELITRENNRLRWKFVGEFDRIGARKVRITKLPFGVTHEQYREKLQTLINKGVVRSIVDGTSSTVNIEVTLATLAQLRAAEVELDITDDDALYEELGLVEIFNENINLVDPDQTHAITDTPENIIKDFTNWRLKFYKDRFEKELEVIKKEERRLKDVLLAIENGANKKSSTIQSKTELKKWLSTIGVDDTEYVSTLPTYRFTKHEVKKIRNEIARRNEEINRLTPLISDISLRKREYIKELRAILRKYGN